MLKRILAGLGVATLLAVMVPAGAEAQMDNMKTPQGTESTVTGTVIDLSCKFRHGLSGDQHRMCAQVCADKGVPLAILSQDGKLYVPVSAGMPGSHESERLKEYAEQGVTVRGVVFQAGGAMAIQIENIERS